MREPVTYGYARVSTRDQNEKRQLDALKAFPISERHIYVDKASGVDFERPAWKGLMRKAHAGDVLVVKSIDRLGRNYAEILEQWREITKVRELSIVVIDTPLLDTRSGTNTLMRTFIADMVLQILSFVAETERDSIKRRQAEGIAAARARGQRLGRPPKQMPSEFENVFAQWAAEKISCREAARKLEVAPATFSKWARARTDDAQRLENTR